MMKEVQISHIVAGVSFDIDSSIGRSPGSFGSAAGLPQGDRGETLDRGRIEV